MDDGASSPRRVTRRAVLTGVTGGLLAGGAARLEPTGRAVGAAGPAVAAWDLGAHTRAYWYRITPDAFRFVGEALQG